jgi:hypothetical protein
MLRMLFLNVADVFLNVAEFFFMLQQDFSAFHLD